MKPFSNPDHNYHYFGYAILVLSGLLLWMTTECWSQIPDVVAYLGFALTLTSFVLSIVAIFQGLVSGSSIIDSIANLHTASGKVELAAQKVEAATLGLSERVSGLKESLDRQTVRDLQRPPTSSSTTPALEDQIVRHFLTDSSPLGLYALKAAVLSGQTGKELVLSEVFGPTDRQRSYVYGYLVASSSFGLFQRRISGDSWTVSSVNQVLTDEISQALNRKTEEIRGRRGSSPILDSLNTTIQEYFQSD